MISGATTQLGNFLFSWPKRAQANISISSVIYDKNAFKWKNRLPLLNVKRRLANMYCTMTSFWCFFPETVFELYQAKHSYWQRCCCSFSFIDFRYAYLLCYKVKDDSFQWIMNLWGNFQTKQIYLNWNLIFLNTYCQNRL